MNATNILKMKTIYGVKYNTFILFCDILFRVFFFTREKQFDIFFYVHNALVRNICKSFFNLVVPYAKVTLIYCNASDWS